MYTITHNGNPFFSPAVGGPSIAEPMLSMDANRLATLSFTVYPDNPEFDDIDMHTSVFNVYLDGALLIKLRPAQKKHTFNGGMEYTCEELAARMDDVLHRPDYFTGTVTEYLTRMITAYNALVDSANAVTLGYVSFIPTTSDTFINDGYEGFWEGIQANLVKYHGGYIIPRYTDSAIYIDYVTDSDLTACSQAIAFGKNMADMFIETDSADVFNVLIPLGASVDVSNPQPGQARRRPLDITSVNSGNDYLVNVAGVALYGKREMTHRWESIDNASTLKTTGQAYLDEHAAELKKSVTLSALDLHNLNVNTSAFQWMQRVTVKSVPHGIDTVYTITRVDIPLGEPKGISLQLGDPQDVMTDRLVQNSAATRGRGGGGTRGGGGRAASDETVKEYGTEITRTDYEISLRAYQRDLEHTDANLLLAYAALGISSDSISSIVTSSGVTLNPDGTIATDANGNPIFNTTTTPGVWSNIKQNADRIALVVDANGIKAAEIVLAINGTGSSVTISADKIYLTGSTTIDNLLSGRSAISKIWATAADIGNLNIMPRGSLTIGNTELVVESQAVSWRSYEARKCSLSNQYYFVDYLGTQVQGRIVTGYTDTTLHYLGSPST